MEAFRILYYFHASATVAGYFFTGRLKAALLIIVASISTFGYFYFQHLLPHHVRHLLSNNNQVLRISAAEFPLCTRGILDKSSYEYSFDSRNVAMKPVHQDPPCRLNHYSQTETVQCFDSLLGKLRLKKESGKLANGDTGEILMVFAGDSRIRQLFYERAKVFPFTHELFNNTHRDMMRNISVFDARVKFQMIWNPKMPQDLLKAFSNWADSNATIPHFILLGIGSHYMRPLDGSIIHMDFERHLTELYPILERLALRMRERSNGKIVWMMQYQYYDRNFINILPVKGTSNKFHRNTLEHLNSIAHRIFRNSSVVQVWDSLLPIVDDYYRGCLEIHRRAPSWLNTWKDCNDEIHAGFAANTQGFQFLLNDLCNHVMMTE